MLLSKNIKTTWNASNKAHYIALGYEFTKLRDELTVEVSDLKDTSNVKVEILCDYCGVTFTRSYEKYLRNRNVTQKDACLKCTKLKRTETIRTLYGVENTFQSENIKNKIKETNLKKYGVEHAFQNKDIKNKVKETNLKKYGVENVFQNKDIKNKIKETNLKKYGVENVMQNEIIKNKAVKNNTKYTFSKIKELIEKEGLELISTEETLNKSDLIIKCHCGELFHVKLSYFLHENKKQCNKCGIKLRSGENSPRWNKNLTDEERYKNRDYPEYIEWRKSVYERDKYTCVICGDNTGGNLNAHHLNSYTKYPQQGTDVNNGVTLCESCHTEFHCTYGYGNNTIEEFLEFYNSIFE